MASLVAAATLLACLLIAGCSADFNAPPSPTTETNAVGTLKGNLQGGQQPIANAHIFVFAVGTGGDAGPGIAAGSTNKATSLISSTTSGAVLDSTIGGYYVLTNSNGDFTITGDYTCTLDTQVYILSLQGEPDGVNNNSAIGMMAVLGNCPSSHTLAGQVGFVYINEISTIAAAYALAGFATDSTHISSNNSTLAQTGVLNAAANAAQLYSISAVPITARATTASGGTVPQALINSLANTLAACVNTTSSSSSNCTTLFNNAKSSGSSGTPATDTATAAINMAHNAGANVSTLFGLGSSSPPFTGLSSAPGDFSIGITYSGFDDPVDVAIDANGSAWFANTLGGTGPGSVMELTHLGVATTFTGSGIDDPLAIAIDQSGNAWVPNAINITKISNGTASLIPFADPNGGWYVAIDKNNDPWFSTYTDTLLYNLTQTGGEVTGSPYTYSSASTPEQIAIDFSGRVWSVNGESFGLDELTNPGSSAILTEYPQSSEPNVRANSGIAIDSSNNIWAVAQTTGLTNGVSNECLAKINPASPGTITTCYDDTSMQGDGVAIDGAGNVWVANGQITGGIGAVEFNPSGTVISPAGGFSGGAQDYPISIAIDGSGDVWLPGTGVSYTGTTVVELIGIATPVVTPISPVYPGKSTTGLGVRP
jgi:hypothetical protein